MRHIKRRSRKDDRRTGGSGNIRRTGGMKAVLLSLLNIFLLTVSLIPAASYIGAPDGGVYNAYAASDRLEIAGSSTVYVQSGGEAIFAIKVKNSSGTELKGVNIYHGYRSIDDLSGGNFVSGSSTFESTDPLYGNGEADKLYRFSSYFEKDGYDAVNAAWDSDEEGYTIAAGATATLWFKARSAYEDPGTYSEWIKLGDTHTEYYGGFVPCTIVDEAYATLSLKAVVYNPSAAALTVGTSSDYGTNISKIATGSAIDFGTVDLTKSTGLSAEKTIYTKNTTAISSSGKDEHGNSQNIKVDFSVENGGSWDIPYPFSASSDLIGGSSWAPLEPATANSFMLASTGITLDASNYVAGTYEGSFTMTAIPHGVKVNGGAIHTNGIYTWPVTVTLTGTNPRIPKAPTNVTATAGNGQVEITWTAGSGAADDQEYQVWRREGKETDTANKDNAGFEWSEYTYVGSDLPDSEGSYLFVDGTVENGKTYTYAVIGAAPLQAYPAISSSAKPLSTLTSKIQKPQDVFADEMNGGIELEWEMNENYGGTDNDGSSMVDHFNVYRDGVLVAQVQQNAVIGEPNYDYVEVQDPDDPDTTYQEYKQVSTSYSWELFAETPIPYQDYIWNVAAVSKSGVEGYWSDDVSAKGYSEDLCVISGHTASANLDWAGDDASTEYAYNKMEVEGWSPNGLKKVEYWRNTGTTAPDTSKTPVYTCSDSRYDVETEFIDKDVAKGKTYTYTARVTDDEGNASDYYTFSIKVPTGSDWWQKVYSSADVSWSTAKKGAAAKLEWIADTAYDDDGSWYYTGTYRVYRNGAVIKTYNASGQSGGAYSFTNDPGSDGTYVYRVDKVINGITIRGRDFTFVRDTAAVDEAGLLQAPGVPVFDVRISDGKPVLRWADSGSGGEVEGYHIYRKDAGKAVNGKYWYESLNGWNDRERYWSNNRYLTVKDAAAGVLVDQDGYYKGEYKYGKLYRVSWEEDSCPHEYYITAYNAAGESEPSQVFTFEFQGGSGDGTADPPTNTDDYAPGTPSIEKVWVDWDDESGSLAYWDEYIGGKLHVAWEDASSSLAAIDTWDVHFSGLNYGDKSETVYAWQVAADNANEGTSSMYSPKASVDVQTQADGGDYGRTAAVSVTAQNSAGSSGAATANMTICSFPRFRATAGNSLVKLQWTDLFKDETTEVKSWEIRRRRESGAWTTIAELDASSLDYEKSGGSYAADSNGVKNYAYIDDAVSNGWTYEYEVVARCADGIERPGVVREAAPRATAAAEAPGAPQNLKASVVNGEILFSWDAPAAGDAQYYQLVREETYSSGTQWVESNVVHAPSTDTVWGYEDEPGEYRFFVYAYSYINGQQVPQGAHSWESDDVDELYPNHSNIVTVTLTQDQIDKKANDYPGSFTLTAAAGENQVALNWTKSSGATYYELYRSAMDNSEDDITITLPASAVSYTDDSAMPGVCYYYKLSACNNCGSVYDDAYATADGISKDEMIANDVMAMIDALPNASSITLNNYIDYKDAVEEAESAYEALTARQKKYVTSDYTDKLAACADKIEQIELNNQYAEVVKPVQDEIDALPGADALTLDDEDKVTSAREAYDGLDSRAKKLVDTARLTEAEARLKELKKAAADKALVDALIADLEALESMDKVTEDNAKSILDSTEALRARIDALDADQAELFENAENAEALVTKLNETDAAARAALGLEHEHLPEFIAEKAATCSEEGNIAYFRCRACGKLFTDESCTTEIEDANDTVLPADESMHNWGEWEVTKEPTCTEEGVMTRVCRNDADHVETLPMGMTAHEWNTEPESETVNEDGTTSYVFKCKNCDATKKGRTSTVDENSACNGHHSWDWSAPVDSRPATCSEEGWVTYRCTNDGCEGTVIEIEEIDPTAHEWGEWVESPDATCTKEGRLVRTCIHNNEHTEVQIIEAKGHEWDDGEVVTPATCSASGVKKYSCKNCDETINRITPADPDNHEWGEWAVIQAPTCTETGLKQRICEQNSFHRETAVVAAAGHTWDAGAEKTTLGIDSYVINRTDTCAVCGESNTVTVTSAKYKVSLPKVKIANGKASKKKFTAKWKKVSKANKKKIGGIEIQVYGNGINKVYTAGKGKSSKAIKGLKSKKKYKYRVRAYKGKGTAKQVSKWSGWKTVKTK